MKKAVAAFALATAGMIALPLSAQTADGNYQPSQPVGSGNWFINANVGKGHLADEPYTKHPTVYGINGGYRWKIGPDLGFGLEVGYNNMGSIHYPVVDTPWGTFTGNQNLQGWTLGVNGRINLWQGLYWSGRAGAYGWGGHSYDDDLDRHNYTGVNWYVGTGVGYDFTERFSLGLAYDYYKANMGKGAFGVRSTDALSLQAEYRF